MRITGTNGQLPRKALESTLLDRVVKTGKVPVRVLNVTAPTMPLYPPGKRSFSLAGDEPPWFKLSEHDGQSGGTAGHSWRCMTGPTMK